MHLEIKLVSEIGLLFSRNSSFIAQRISGNNGGSVNKMYRAYSSQQSSLPQSTPDTEEFRVLDLKQKKNPFVRRKAWKAEVMPPRTTQMAVDQDWPSVWPGPRSFHPAAVPLPVRQGYTSKGAAPPGKFANAELMKIPNFLHLTPPAIKKQCEALKQFCTAWPGGLETDEKCEKNFPLEIISSDYCHSSPVIRNPLARIVTIKVKLSSLPLDRHAKDKMLRLVGERYNASTDEITIVADRCPLKQQNYDFALYILTALYHEAWQTESWESEKSEVDMEYYDWDRSVSQQSLKMLMKWPTMDSSDVLEWQSKCSEYKTVVSDLFNTGEDLHATNRYKEVVLKLLALPESKSSTKK